MKQSDRTYPSFIVNSRNSLTLVAFPSTVVATARGHAESARTLVVLDVDGCIDRLINVKNTHTHLQHVFTRYLVPPISAYCLLYE